jgi:hypothetical protein
MIYYYFIYSWVCVSGVLLIIKAFFLFKNKKPILGIGLLLSGLLVIIFSKRIVSTLCWAYAGL